MCSCTCSEDKGALVLSKMHYNEASRSCAYSRCVQIDAILVSVEGLIRVHEDGVEAHIDIKHRLHW